MPKTITIQTPFGPMTQTIEDDADSGTALSEAFINLAAKLDKMQGLLSDIQGLLIKVLLK